MSEKNRHGLSRHIPEEIKRLIRQNSKFGCVVPYCREAIYEYEHIDPEFKDALEHNPDNICLVCPKHNPRNKGKEGEEYVSKDQLKNYYSLIKETEEVPKPKTPDFFSGFTDWPIIKIGKSNFAGIKSIINIRGVDIFSFQKNDGRYPFEPEIIFSAKFHGPDGKKIFEVEKNEWICETNNFDVEVKNGKFSIWDQSKEVVFKASKLPEKNVIHIEKLNFWYYRCHILLSEENLIVAKYSKDLMSCIYTVFEADFQYGNCGIYIQDEKDSPLKYGDFQVRGGQGLMSESNGIYVGRGCSNIYLRGWHFDFIGKVELIQNQSKKTTIPDGAHLFVVGKLTSQVEKYPSWEETKFFLNGIKLTYKPNSWGQINEDGDELFYISSHESQDLISNKGFIGFYADDVLKQSWADKAFEVDVEEISEDGFTYSLRVKVCDINGRKVLYPENYPNERPIVPQHFAGCDPWKSN